MVGGGSRRVEIFQGKRSRSHGLICRNFPGSGIKTPFGCLKSSAIESSGKAGISLCRTVKRADYSAGKSNRPLHHGQHCPRRGPDPRRIPAVGIKPRAVFPEGELARCESLSSDRRYSRCHRRLRANESTDITRFSPRSITRRCRSNSARILYPLIVLIDADDQWSASASIRGIGGFNSSVSTANLPNPGRP